MAYQLYYWPGAQGRGEFVRLALEESGAAYVDVARGSKKGQGIPALMKFLGGGDVARPPFAPPFLKDGEVVVAQTSAILFYLGTRIGLAPKNEADRLWTHQIQLTIADFVDEIHDTHHPLGTEYYYEDMKPEAKKRAKQFREARLPKFLGWFETILARNPAGDKHLVGRKLTYADLSLFQIVEGLNHAFPKATGKALAKTPLVAALHDAVAARPRIKAYCKSPRRLEFNNVGVFRHYPELDG